jgi:hypothetical protein
LDDLGMAISKDVCFCAWTIWFNDLSMMSMELGDWDSREQEKSLQNLCKGLQLCMI